MFFTGLAGLATGLGVATLGFGTGCGELPFFFLSVEVLVLFFLCFASSAFFSAVFFAASAARCFSSSSAFRRSSASFRSRSLRCSSATLASSRRIRRSSSRSRASARRFCSSSTPFRCFSSLFSCATASLWRLRCCSSPARAFCNARLRTTCSPRSFSTSRLRRSIAIISS